MNICTIKLKGHKQTIQIHNIYNPQQTNNNFCVLPKLLKTKEKHILLGDFNLHHPFWGGVTIISADDIANNFICATKAIGLNLVIKVGIKTWAKGTSTSTLNLVFTSFWITNKLLQN